MTMSKAIVSGFSLSIDGYGAGPDQSLEDPHGKHGEELHTWMVETAMFHEMLGKDGGSRGIDLPALGFSVIEHAATDDATHIVLAQ